MSLNDVERKITMIVVDRFLNERSPTSRKSLLIEFKAPDLIDGLETKSILRKFDLNNDGKAELFPKLLAFLYCGDAEIAVKARKGTTLVMEALHRLFISEADKTVFDATEVEAAARKQDANVDAQEIKLGLYLVQEFNLFSYWGSYHEGTEPTHLAPNERVVTLDSPAKLAKEWDEHIETLSRYLRRGESTLEHIPVPTLARESGDLQENTVEKATGAPKVFVSYSWDSQEHKQWVLDFASRLRKEGVDVILDHWHLRPGGDKARFMEQSVVNSDFVILVCTPRYAERANERTGGVGYEALIITGELAAQTDIEKFIPVLRTGEFESSLPCWIKAKLGIDLQGQPYSATEYEKLLRAIHREPISAPPLGPKPPWGFTSNAAAAEAIANAVDESSDAAGTKQIERLTWPEGSPDLRIEKWGPVSQNSSEWYRRGFHVYNQGNDVAKAVKLEKFSIKYATRNKTVWIEGKEVNLIDPKKISFLEVNAEYGSGLLIATDTKWELVNIFGGASRDREQDWLHSQGVAFDGGEIYLTYEGLNSSKYHTVTKVIYQPRTPYQPNEQLEFIYVRRERGVIEALGNVGENTIKGDSSLCSGTDLGQSCVVNRDQIQKNLWWRVRLRPVPLRTDGTEADDEWVIESIDDAGVTIKTHTGHHPVLAYDHIREFMTDPMRDTDGLKHGFLHLKVQMHFTNQGVRIEPLWKQAGEDTMRESSRSGRSVDRGFAIMAIKEARHSVAEDERPHPKVGAVVVKDGNVVSTAHRGESPKSHAEYIALEKKLADDLIAGATVYTTLEPCTTRNHPKIPCAKRLIERRVKRVVIGLLDPNPVIRGKGWQMLNDAGIETEMFDLDLRKQVEELNREFIRSHATEPNQAETRTDFSNIVFTLIKDRRGAVARIGNLGSSTLWVESVEFQVLDKGQQTVIIRRTSPPHSDSIDCPMPEELVRQIVLTNDVGVAMTYKLSETAIKKTPMKLFNIVASHGQIASIKDGGRFLSFAHCSVCGKKEAFGTEGIMTVEDMEERRKAVEADLNASCPQHKSDAATVYSF